MSDHPGFEFWNVNDAAHPFPVGDITLNWSDDTGASASAEMSVPVAQPTAATVAERYIGVVDLTQLWFALECSTLPNGAVTCEAVLRGKHLHWFPDHGETAPGPEQELRLTAADLKGGGRKEALSAHGPHCDLFSVTWFQNAGKVRFELIVTHWRETPRGFLDARKRHAHEAESWPRGSYIIIPHDDSMPAPPPKPDPGPNPN